MSRPYYFHAKLTYVYRAPSCQIDRDSSPSETRLILVQARSKGEAERRLCQYTNDKKSRGANPMLLDIKFSVGEPACTIDHVLTAKTSSEHLTLS